MKREKEIPVNLAETEKSTPLVSVIITTRNRLLECVRCIQSVAAQDYPNLEIFVVEDGSASGVEKFVRESKITNIHYMRLERRGGLAKARNTGLQAARGTFVAFVDDDDIWKTSRISKQLLLWNNIPYKEKIALIYCGLEVKDAAENTRAIIKPQNGGNLKASIISHGIKTIPSTYLLPTQTLRELGQFDENLPSSIDHDLWMNIAVHDYDVAFVDEPLVVMYERDYRDTMMSNTSERLEGIAKFIEKWQPAWRQWYGSDVVKYTENYLIYSVGLLVGQKVQRGHIKEAFKGYSFLLEKVDSPIRCTFLLTWHIARKLGRAALSR